VARLSIRSGFDVVISNSRGPETLSELVKELGPKAKAATVQEAALAGNIVVVSVPLKNYRAVPVEPPRDRGIQTLVDENEIRKKDSVNYRGSAS